MERHHKINYIEFTANDFNAVKKFYSSVFGWTFTDYGEDYTAFTDGMLDGGFAKGASSTDGALVILYSDNLEETQSLVEQNGGTITEPIFEFPGGRRFHFTDPAGNKLAVWSAH